MASSPGRPRRTPDDSTVARVADTISVMQNGEVVEFGTTGTVLRPPHHPYTELLLRHLTLARAARLAAMTLEEFVELLGQAGIPAADYPPEELDDEFRAAS